MTTIAYKDGWLVSDSRETSGERVDTDRCKKIYRLPDGSLYAGSGESAIIMHLYQELLKAARVKKKVLPNIQLKGINAIVVANKKNVNYYEKGIWTSLDYPFAIGTGSHYALAAMDNGASAEEAVRIACKRDIYSGGRLQKYRVQ